MHNLLCTCRDGFACNFSVQLSVRIDQAYASLVTCAWGMSTLRDDAKWRIPSHVMQDTSHRCNWNPFGIDVINGFPAYVFLWIIRLHFISVSYLFIRHHSYVTIWLQNSAFVAHKWSCRHCRGFGLIFIRWKNLDKKNLFGCKRIVWHICVTCTCGINVWHILLVLKLFCVARILVKLPTDIGLQNIHSNVICKLANIATHSDHLLTLWRQ